VLCRGGQWEFAAKRPSWELPVHTLMAKNRVTVFFQGHDHLFAVQRLDGIVYQECPMPGNSGCYGQGGYTTGDILPSAGHMRVNVAADAVTVDYIRAYSAQDEREGRKNGAVDYSYTISADGSFKVNSRSSQVVHSTEKQGPRLHLSRRRRSPPGREQRPCDLQECAENDGRVQSRFPVL